MSYISIKSYMSYVLRYFMNYPKSLKVTSQYPVNIIMYKKNYKKKMFDQFFKHFIKLSFSY